MADLRLTVDGSPHVVAAGTPILLLHGLVVDADRAAADLDAVEREVVAARDHGVRLGERPEVLDLFAQAIVAFEKSPEVSPFTKLCWPW